MKVELVLADSLVGLTEAGALLNLEADALLGLAMGPFAPTEPDHLTLRSVLGIYLTVFLTDAKVMSLAHVIHIAVEASKGAADDGTRSLAIVWQGRNPSMRWISSTDLTSFDKPIHDFLLTIPVDQTLVNFGRCLAVIRASEMLTKPH